MATHKLETRLEVSGEAEYKKALSDARREVSLLKTEQRLIKARFEQTGDKEKYAADMADLLNRKANAQKTIVSAVKNRLQSLADDGVDKTDKKYQALQQTLLNAEIDLTNTETQIKNLKTAHTDLSAAADGSKKSVEDANAEIGKTKGLAETARDGLEWVRDKAEKIGNITGAMDFTAMNAALKNIQKLIDPNKENKFLNNFTAGASQLTAVSQTAKGVAGFADSLLKASPMELAMTAAGALAISLVSISQTLTELETARKFAWIDELNSLDAGISEEGVKAIEAGIKRGIESGVKSANIKQSIGEQVTKSYAEESFELVTAGYGNKENIGAAAAAATLEAEELEKAAAAAKAEADAALQTEIINAKNAGDLEAAAAAQEKLTENEQTYQQILQLGGARRIARLNEVAAGGASILGAQDLDFDKMNWNLENLELYYKALAAIQDDASSVFEFDENDELVGLSDYAKQLAELWGLSLEDFQGQGIFEIAERLTQELGDAAKESVNDQNFNLLADLFKSWSDQGLLEGIDFTQATGPLLAAYRAALIKDAAGEDKKLDKDELFQILAGAAFQSAGSQAGEGFAGGMDGSSDDVSRAAGDLGDTALTSLMESLDEHSPSKETEIIGGNAAVGLANGIYARGDEAIRAAEWLADSVTNIMQDALQIHSPSKVFERLGAFTGLGFAEGIEESASAVSQAVGAMVGAAAGRPAVAYGGIALPAGSPARPAGSRADGSGTVHVTMVLDEDVLGDVMAPIVNDKIGAKINAVRR